MNKSIFQSFSDAQLLTAFKEDDIAAFEEIYKRYWLTLFKVALKQTNSKQDAEELVQVLFERIWKNRKTTVINNIGAYLTVSLRNLIIDFFRQKATQKQFRESQDFVEEANLTEEEVNKIQLLNLIENLLLELPQKTQIVFKLSRYENKSNKEIAEMLELTTKAVEYHITQTIKHLKHFLKSYFVLLFLLNH